MSDTETLPTIMKYFKRDWEETRGDEFDNWGTSTFYFETDETGLPIKQLEKYQNGQVLKFDQINPLNQFGMLSDQTLDLDEFKNFEITKEEFQNIWSLEVNTKSKTTLTPEKKENKKWWKLW